MNLPYGPLLIVEDVPNILELLEVTLRYKGYPVVTACNGQEALNRITNDLPSLIITDILMPKMDGFALAFKLRRDPKTCQIPIIFLSATYITPEDKNFALSLGAARFLEKPVDTEEFLLTVAETMTSTPLSLPPPLEEEEFLQGYRRRLEVKMRHKSSQITRMERLLETLPAAQKPAFQALLDEARDHHSQIQSELDDLYHQLEQRQ